MKHELASRLTIVSVRAAKSDFMLEVVIPIISTNPITKNPNIIGRIIDKLLFFIYLALKIQEMFYIFNHYMN